VQYGLSGALAASTRPDMIGPISLCSIAIADGAPTYRYASSEFTPDPGALIVVAVNATYWPAGAMSVDDSLGGIAWSSTQINQSGATNPASALFYGFAPANPRKGKVALTLPATAGGISRFTVWQISGATSIGGTLATTSTSLGGNLSVAPASTSLVMAVSTAFSGMSYTGPPSGHSWLLRNIQDPGPTFTGAVSFKYQSASQTVTFGGPAAWSPATVAIEIKH